MSRDLKPYIGLAGPALYKADTTDKTDNGTPVQAYIKTKSLVPSENFGRAYSVTDTILTALSALATAIRLTLIKDFQLTGQTEDTDLSPDADETHVMRGFHSAQNSEMGVVQVQLGDAEAVSSAWSLHSLMTPVSDDGTLAT